MEILCFAVLGGIIHLLKRYISPTNLNICINVRNYAFYCYFGTVEPGCKVVIEETTAKKVC